MKLSEKERLTLTIRKQGINGEGIGYINRKAIFVPGAIRKEVVEVEIEKVFDRYATAKLIKIERPSKKRKTPPCKFYDQCGNCHMQHIEYREQLKNKQSILEQSFKRYTSLSDVKDKIDYTLNNQTSYGYQTYQEFVLKNTNFGLAMGYFHPVTRKFVYIDECIILNQEMNQIASLAMKMFRRHKLKAYDGRNREGHLYNLVIRYFKDTDSAAVVFVVKKMIPALQKVANDMMNAFQSIQSVGYSVFNPDSHIVLYHDVKMLAGEERLSTHIHDLSIQVSAKGVFPRNPEVFELMNEDVVEHTAMSHEDHVLNLYEGSSISSLYFSNFAKKVIAVDYEKASIEDAIVNQELLQIPNLELIENHVESVLPNIFKDHKDIQILVLNTPRQGLSQMVIQLINKYKPDQIAYISENPSTLAKDIDQLMEHYKVRKIIPVDMFPQTIRIDSMTFLERKVS